MKAPNELTGTSGTNASAWDDPSEMLARAQSAQQQGDHELAYQMYARASELNPQDAYAWQGRAQNSKSADEALVSYAYAAALNPTNQPLAQKLDESLNARLKGASRDDVPALNAIGQEFAEVGLSSKAETIFRRALELDNSSTDALVWLAGMVNEPERQIVYLERAVVANPLDPRARAALMLLKPASVPPAPAPAPAPTVTPRITRPSAQSTIPPITRPISREPVIPAGTPSRAATPSTPPPVPTENVATLLAQAEATTDEDKRLELYERVLLLDPANAVAREARTMLRVRRLRDTARLADAEQTVSKSTSPHAAGLVNSPPVATNRLRGILILLILLVIVLALAGLYLTFFK